MAPRTRHQLQVLRELLRYALARHYHYPGDPDAQLPGEPDYGPSHMPVEWPYGTMVMVDRAHLTLSIGMGAWDLVRSSS